MCARPGRTLRTQQDLPDPGDRQRIQLAVTRAVAAPLDRRAHAIVNTRRATDVRDAQTEHLAPRLRAHEIVARAADEKVALFERVSQRERAPQWLSP